MTDYTIKCDTIARLSNVIGDETVNEWFRTIRIDNGVAVASDRKLMVAENIGGPAGIIHLICTPNLIAQCKYEAQFNGVLTITVIEELKFATAKTTYGYVEPNNCCLWSAERSADFDRWRELANSVREPATQPNGAMHWNTAYIHRLSEASPSGCIIFEEIIDLSRYALVRDIHDPNWFGLFNGYLASEEGVPATLPGWMK
jgi:hypothetical protein